MDSFHEHKDDLRRTLLVRVGTTASFTTVSSVATTDTSTCTQRSAAVSGSGQVLSTHFARKHMRPFRPECKISRQKL